MPVTLGTRTFGHLDTVTVTAVASLTVVDAVGLVRMTVPSGYLVDT
jgi:hypothetical protein